MNEYPKYVGVKATNNPKGWTSALVKGSELNGRATYRRPKETGNWEIDAQWKEDQLTVCGGQPLAGRMLVPITKKSFKKTIGTEKNRGHT